jgi:protease-4
MLRPRHDTGLASALRLALLVMVAIAPARWARASDTPQTHASAQPAKPPAPVLVDLALRGDLAEEPAPVGLDGQPARENLKAVVDTLARARGDAEVKGVILRLRGVAVGWGKSHELRQAIRGFRSSGKRVVAVLEMAGNTDYLVATAADEVVMPESGWLMLKGLAAEVTFYKGLFDKLCVSAETVQVGDYKGAGEPYSRVSMSPALREELTSVLNDRYEQMSEAIAGRQGITREAARALIDGGPYTPEDARRLGLVNRVAYADQVEAEVGRGLGLTTFKLETRYGKKPLESADMSGMAGLLKMMQMLSGDGARKASSKAPKIALIYASGMIQTGRSSGSILGGSVIGSDTVIKNLRQAAADPTVKAIVLRVDSPGGSALASDLIWRTVTRLEKPIVASMSDVAASGGYYISMGCRKVFAEPGTLTGSIGVISVKLSAGGLLAKMGLNTDTVTVGKNATFESVVAPWSDPERAAMKRLSMEIYRQFVSKAAQGRKMAVADLEKKAGGRIYTGRQAKKEGLVDEVGTLDDAIAEAKSLAGLSRSEATELLVLPKPQSVLESLVAPFDDRDAASALAQETLPEPLRAPLRRVGRLLHLLAAEPAVLIEPFEVRFR